MKSVEVVQYQNCSFPTILRLAVVTILAAPFACQFPHTKPLPLQPERNNNHATGKRQKYSANVPRGASHCLGT